jgi:hypothetical protein
VEYSLVKLVCESSISSFPEKTSVSLVVYWRWTVPVCVIPVNRFSK